MEERSASIITELYHNWSASSLPHFFASKASVSMFTLSGDTQVFTAGFYAPPPPSPSGWHVTSHSAQLEQTSTNRQIENCTDLSTFTSCTLYFIARLRCALSLTVMLFSRGSQVRRMLTLAYFNIIVPIAFMCTLGLRLQSDCGKQFIFSSVM